MITWRQGFYRVSVRATGSTSTKRGPDDPAEGLYPVLHVALGAGHEQERLGLGRHLLPLPGTTCKTGRHRLTAGPLCRQRCPSPTALSAAPTRLALYYLGWESPRSNTFQQQPLWLLIMQPIPPHLTSLSLGHHLFPFSPLVLLFFHIKSEIIKIILGHILETKKKSMPV